MQKFTSEPKTLEFTIAKARHMFPYLFEAISDDCEQDGQEMFADHSLVTVILDEGDRYVISVNEIVIFDEIITNTSDGLVKELMQLAEV